MLKVRKGRVLNLLSNYHKYYRMNILAVDDEKGIQPLFQQRFRKEIRKDEFNFVFACSGEEARKYLENNQHKAVLVLTDINMPGMSGLDLLGKIKQKHNEPPTWS